MERVLTLDVKINLMTTTWNLKHLYQSDNDPNLEKDLKISEKESYKFINRWKKRKDYLSDPKALKLALDEYESYLKNYGPTGNTHYYFWLRTKQDQNDPSLKARLNKIEDQAKKIDNDLKFFTISIAKIKQSSQKKFLSFKPLSPYKHYLEKEFANAKYLLSEKEEKILTLKSSPAHSNWVKMLTGLTSKQQVKVLTEAGKKETKTFEDIIGLISSQNKKVRDSAAKAFNKILINYLDVAENEINSVLENKKTTDQLRGLPRPDSGRIIRDDLDEQTVDTLIKVVTSHFDISCRYYKLKAALMGVKKLDYHERNVPFGKVDQKYNYSQSVKLISKVFNNLDKDFGSIFDKFVSKGHVDVYPKKGKFGGAFCVYSGVKNPTFILLNHTDKIRDITTLAHEAGHGINNELIKLKQNEINFGTPTSTAEVASTFFEDFVFQELLKKADPETRLGLMMQKLNDDISTISRQVAFYNFETDLHKEFREKSYLSHQEIGKLFQSHMESYMGDFIKQSKGSENWWLYVSHFRSFFYVYSYASGLLISKALQNKLKKDSKFIEKIKDFLATGLSKSPKDIFSSLGIDISDSKFWEQGLNEVEDLLTETENLAKKLGKI